MACCILRKEDRLRSAFGKQGVPVTYLGRQRHDPLVIRDIIKLVRERDIHVLHLHGYGSQLFGGIAGLVTRVPTIIHGHGVD